MSNENSENSGRIEATNYWFEEGRKTIEANFSKNGFIGEYGDPRKEELEKLRTRLIQEAYRRTSEYQRIIKLTENNPNESEEKIIDLIKSAREKVGKEKWLFLGGSSVMTNTNRSYLIDSVNKYSFVMNEWSKGEPEIEGPFFTNSEEQTTGKIMIYHWALKSSVPMIQKHGLLPAVICGSGSGTAALNYATLDLNNNWASAGIGGEEVNEKDKFELLQIDIGGSELVSWTYFNRKGGGRVGGWNSSLFSSKTLDPNGVGKMYHRFLREDQKLLETHPFPDVLPEYQEDFYRYSYKMKDLLSGGFFNSSEEEEMMFWYAAPKRIRVIERKAYDRKMIEKFFRAKHRWSKQVAEYRKTHPFNPDDE